MYDSKTHLFLELVLAEFWPAKYWFASSTNQVTDQDQNVLRERRNFSGFFRIEEQRDLSLAGSEFSLGPSMVAQICGTEFLESISAMP
jgi:hypothetical protein